MKRFHTCKYHKNGARLQNRYHSSYTNLNHLRKGRVVILEQARASLLLPTFTGSDKGKFDKMEWQYLKGEGLFYGVRKKILPLQGLIKFLYDMIFKTKVMDMTLPLLYARKIMFP